MRRFSERPPLVRGPVRDLASRTFALSHFFLRPLPQEYPRNEECALQKNHLRREGQRVQTGCGPCSWCDILH